MTHQPDITKIPESLRALDWKPMPSYPDNEWWDGQVLLVSLPICDDKDRRKWWYEFHVVTIECDEDYFKVKLDGEPWGWELDDADYYVVIRK